MAVDRLAATALALLVVLGGCSKDTEPSTGRAMPEEERRALRTPGAPATLTDLRDLGYLRAQFNAHQDVPQLVLLFSPT